MSTPRAEAPVENDRASTTASISGRVLGVLTAAVMLVVVVVLSVGLWVQLRSYNQLIPVLTSASAPSAPALIAVSRSLDAAIVKTSALFVAFLLILLGGAYTLRVGEAAFKVSVGGDVAKGTLQTASPGLVIVTLGAVLVAITILKQQTVELSSAPGDGVGAVSVVNTSTIASTDQQARTDERDVQTLTRVTGHLHSTATTRSLTDADLRDAKELAARVDVMRLNLALRRFPELAPRYAEFVELQRQNREAAIQAISPKLAEQFRQVQALLDQ
jgi:hypothetical protein